MNNEMDHESHKEIKEHEEVSAVPGRTPEEQEAQVHGHHDAHGHDAHGHDTHGHGGHGHGHGDEEPIVLVQEKLVPTMLMATAFVVVTLFGLATAGNTKLDVTTGKAAFDKIEQQKPKLDNKNHANGQGMSIAPNQGHDQQNPAAGQGHQEPAAGYQPEGDGHDH